jgi:hypothetical protein
MPDVYGEALGDGRALIAGVTTPDVGPTEQTWIYEP